jgi:spermidine/putrescine transport system permease protein
VIHDPLPLLFNQGAVLAGLLHTYLPFMILPVYAAVERTDDRLIEAARDLGANGLTTFRRVVLPQTTRAAIIGSILVFTAALGAFVTPDLLGGRTSLMVASVIESQVLQVRDWNFASALAFLLLLTAGVCVLLYRFMMPRRRET